MASIWDGEVVQVSAVADVEIANRYATEIEDKESRMLGLTVDAVRPTIASRLGISPGTLENIRRLRTKIVPHWLMTRIRAEFIAVLQREIQALENEIQLARQIGRDHRDNDLAKAQAQVAKAKAILRGTA